MAGDFSRTGFQPARRSHAVAIALGILLVSMNGCGDDGSSSGDASLAPDAGGAGGTDAGFYPSVDPADPCAVAGYVFDGESACDVVRCPELTCECEASEGVDAGELSSPPQTIALSACVPGAGCLHLADCKRVCDRELELSRKACEERIAGAGAQRCDGEADCAGGACRRERVGSICVDALGCGEDGHCGDGSACLFEPSAFDEGSQSGALGTCADGLGGSRCYDDADCMFGRCSSQLCTAGGEGEQCTSDRNCASGLCRITGTAALPEGTVEIGSCTRGERGSACSDDGDCGGGLHCTGSVCFSDEVGQSCERDNQCASGTCVAGRCRGGEPGSQCEEDDDCTSGVCASYRCASGGVLSPCYEASDCASDLVCVGSLCSDGSALMPCSSDADCTVLGCVSGICSAGEDGARCDADDDCVSQRCADPAGADRGVCTSGEPGAVCVSDLSCVSGSCAFNGVCE